MGCYDLVMQSGVNLTGDKVMVVDCGCQFDGILNHHRNKPPDIKVRCFLNHDN